jgi:hypothetical protein
MRTRPEHTGFIPPNGHSLGEERRTVAVAELVAIAALAVSTVIVATVVSAGIAHASVVDGVIDHEGSVFAAALLLGLIFIGISGLSMLPGGRPKKH